MLPILLVFFAAAATAVPQGYVDDAACTPCHVKIAQTFKHVGMGKSFYRPRESNAIEDFSKLPFRHQRSGDVMELRWRDGKLIFRRWQLDASGKPINLFEVPVDWILGSGDHARTYLYRTGNGELYELPIAWYSQTHEWGMPPGYDRADHDGVLRRARVECLFCHNAYGDVAKNVTAGHWRNQVFPDELPEGIGCQRCHGPGAEHVSLANSDADKSAVRASIVQPSRLDPKLRNDVCYQCHMQPSVAFAGIRRFGRDINSFRPGEPLPSYIVHLDILDSEIKPVDRFEINHHPYRLEQSRCFRESGGRLSCLSCHDPHTKTADVRPVCKSCHEKAHRASEDCVACHMPKHRTQDVVRIAMTDHRIGIYRDLPSLISPRDEREPAIEEIHVTDGDRAPADAAFYRVVAAARAGSAPAARKLEQMLAANPSAPIEPFFDVAAAQLQQKRYGSAENTARAILARAPDHPLGLELLALARGRMGDTDSAISLLRKAANLDPRRPETEYNLGRQLAAAGDRKAAAEAFERAIALRSNLVAAWIQLGDVREEKESKLAAYKRALEIDPRSKAALAALAKMK